MRRGRTIVGLPVISIAQGTRIGVVEDLVIDLDRRWVAALSLGGQHVAGAVRVVPFDAIRGAGRDAVTVQDDSAVVLLSDRPDLERLYASPVRLVGLQVVTEEGSRPGRIHDVLVDELSGEIVDYEVSGGTLRDAIGGRCYVRADTLTSLGPDLMIVSSTCLPGVERRPQAQSLAVSSSPSPQSEPLHFEANPEPGDRLSAARALWEQVGDRLAFLTGRR